MTERIISLDAQNHFPGALEKVYMHTRHVELTSDLEPEAVKRLLNRVRRLLTVR